MKFQLEHEIIEADENCPAEMLEMRFLQINSTRARFENSDFVRKEFERRYNEAKERLFQIRRSKLNSTLPPPK